MIINKKYNISNSYHKRIILISDIHFCNKKIVPLLYELLDNIKELKPDYLCITGDLVDDKNIKDKEYLLDWIKDLSKICKILISIGNHELYFNHNIEESFDKELFDQIDRIKNVYVLNNKIRSEYGINFIGVTLPGDYYDLGEQENDLIYFMNKKFPKLDKGYNILLLHSPYHITKKEVLNELKCNKKLNLILSGHMHAGLTFEWLKKYLKGRGLITPQRTFFTKYCYGLYSVNDTKVIISSGITKLAKSHIFGLFNKLYKSEIVTIDL